MSNILITAIGSFSADVVIERLKKEGHNIIGCDIYPKDWIANSLSVNKFYQAPYVTDKEKYLNFLKVICKEEQINYLIPLTDVEVDVINANRELFINTIICLSAKESIEICRNKYSLYKFLKSQNIECLIPTGLLSDVSLENIKYPVVIKPYNGRSSQGLNYIESKSELEIFLNKNHADNYVIQPKVLGRIITVDVLRNNSFFVATARAELLRTLNGAGTSVTVFFDEYLWDTCKEIAERLNIIGCVNFEFIQINEHEYKFLECNPRFSGGVAFSCMAGYDYVCNHLKCYSKEKPDEFFEIHEMTIARKYREYITKG